MTRRPVAEQGWDSVAEVVDDDWIERTPRRPEVRLALEVEARLLPRIAPLLPLSVPVPTVVPADASGPWRVRHRLVPGAPVDPAALTSRDGTRVGELLRVLHGVPFPTWARAGVTEDVHLHPTLGRMAAHVLPRLPHDLHAAGTELLEKCGAPGPLTLAHGDLGPQHLLHTGCTVTGVIDWTDAGLRDPAIDLAWVLHGTPDGFADALAAAYRPGRAELDRARAWHRLGPWYEVLHGLDLLALDDDTGRRHVDDGLAGAVERLRRSDH